MELKQKRIWDKRHFKLLDDGVWMKINTPIEDAELKVKYEELGLDIVYVRQKSGSIVFAVLAVLSAIAGRLILEEADLEKGLNIALVGGFFIFLFVVLFLAWSDSRKPLIGINGGEKTLALLRNSPDPETVDKFVNEIQERIKDRIIKLRVRPDDEEMNFGYKKQVLDLLKEENVIDDKKYAEVLNQITAHKNKIGFTREIEDTDFAN